jgi:hypothetical protein
LLAAISLDSKNGDHGDEEDVPKPSKSKSGKSSKKKKCSKSEKKHNAPSLELSLEPSLKETKGPAPGDNVSSL